MPIPWMKTTGSLVLDVCGLCQYVTCLTDDLYFVNSETGRKGKSVKNREIGARWKWKPCSRS